MNIKQAKDEIRHTVQAYLTKDALGDYANSCGQTETDSSDRTAGYRQDSYYVTGGKGVWCGTGFLYDYPSYETERHRSAIHREKEFRRQRVFNHRIHNE